MEGRLVGEAIESEGDEMRNLGIGRVAREDGGAGVEECDDQT